MTALRTATAAAHRDIEGVAVMQALLAGNLPRSGYLRLLNLLYHFHLPLDKEIEQHSYWQQRDFDIRLRRKSDWLEQDIQALGGEIACELPAFTLPPLQTTEQLMGCLYVMEGSSLGAVSISKLLREHYGYDSETGGRFYAAYGKQTRPFWDETTQLIEQAASQPNFNSNDCTQAAHDTFLTYHTVMSFYAP